jgi:DNA-binding response OmpR family regulator
MNYTILIADDEPEIRTLLRLYLENENYVHYKMKGIVGGIYLK